MFRVIVHQALDSVQSVLGVQSTVVMQAVNQQMEDFLVKVFQLDPLSISQDHDSIEALAA